MPHNGANRFLDSDTIRAGLQKGEGGRFIPTEMQVKKVLVILKGGRKQFLLFKRLGRKNFYPVLRGVGEGTKKFPTCDFPSPFLLLTSPLQ